MADGICTGVVVGDFIEKIPNKDCETVDRCQKRGTMDKKPLESVNKFYLVDKSDKLYDKLCSNNALKLEDELMPCEEECRRKRCVDRYDSSESSDSGVAVLSCTDCSGSSTASSDITDPGSPFSTASNHSEDSVSQSAKMPPTQNTHHSPWSWNAEDRPLLRRNLDDRTNCQGPEEKKKRTNENGRSKVAPTIPEQARKTTDSNLCSKPKTSKLPKKQEVNKMHQGKITEYFKTHVKPVNGFKSKGVAARAKNKSVPVVDQQTQFDSLKAQNMRRCVKSVTSKKQPPTSKAKKFVPVSVPRKILPAPAKSETITIRNNVNNIINFPLALSTVNFTPNLTYLHTKVPKPPDNIFAPQFASITDKINAIPSAIPIINRTQCLNVIQPIHPKIATINNFNCVKLNATVVPIVKVNNLPSKLNGSNRSDILGGQPNDLGLLETAMPTVLTPKQLNLGECQPVNVCQPVVNIGALASVNQCIGVSEMHTPMEIGSGRCHVDLASSSECHGQVAECRGDSQGSDFCCSSSNSETVVRDRTPSPNTCTSSSSDDSGISSEVCSDRSSVEKSISSDSGVSDSLEIKVNVPVSVESQKSPILSKPKTIRFPFKQKEIERRDSQKSLSGGDSASCRWADCTAQFDTSGALLEHLQHKHVISQATRDEYTCFWSGCKVHGRTSCSRSWLERHVLAHAGTKLFRCIVDGCRQRFNSQLTLQRHVNGHFNADGKPTDPAKKSPENSSTKLFKRNGKKIRFRRQPWSARMFDFIDSGIMEGVQYKLMALTQKRTGGDISTPGDEIKLQSEVLARRIGNDGTANFLIRWHPQDIVSDEWVTEKEFKTVKVVRIPSLDAPAKDALIPALGLGPENTRKHRRKPMKRQT
ncbi:uncharacterized protein LOC123308998 [Coccinella septempunctata]|uniref:uncharacterized protein LOC123308998 n=1 Tax=Coccinella septempunctata TaxID=41139 RepID=UPI001D082621|nr:uncharacterized protein LOC123308998 [Coccinella septempunctata]